MGLFNFFKKENPKKSKSVFYDMDSLEGINAIPVPAKNYHTGDPLKDNIYYVLQRKATEHKRNHRMDLAIACLRKSNELSDYEDRPLLMEKEYMRLVKYLEYDKQFEAAAEEKEKILNHFGDKRSFNLPKIKDTLSRCKKYNEDIVLLTTNNSCPICKAYNHKQFSISGKSSIYPKLPTDISEKGGFCNNCSISLNIVFDGISSNSKKKNPRTSSEEQLAKSCLKNEKNVVDAVKAYRKVSGVPLKEAKEIIDKYR